MGSILDNEYKYYPSYQEQAQMFRRQAEIEFSKNPKLVFRFDCFNKEEADIVLLEMNQCPHIPCWVTWMTFDKGVRSWRTNDISGTIRSDRDGYNRRQ